MSHPDHFALFALPPRFALDEAALERAHKDVQSKVHPDRFAAGSAVERRVAMQWAARANEAYTTLKSPLARAAYLCERAGVAIEGGSNTSMPGAFLVQQMQWRESLDDAQQARDGARLARLMAATDAERARVIAAIAEAIDGEGNHAAAAALVRQLMFIDRFRDEVRTAVEFSARPREASA